MPQDEEDPVLRKLEEVNRSVDALHRKAKLDRWVRILGRILVAVGAALTGIGAFLGGLAEIIKLFSAM